MKNLKDIIKESTKFTSEVDRIMPGKHGTPDGITAQVKSIPWSSEYARAFIYNTKLDKTIFSEEGEAHSDIIFLGNPTDLKEIGLDKVRGTEELRPDEAMTSEELEEWMKLYGENTITFKTGRVFDLRDAPNSLADEKDKNVYIVYWNELESNEYVKINNSVLKYYNKKHYSKNPVDDYYFIDNNGELMELSINDTKGEKIKKRSDDYQEEVNKALQNHNPEIGETWEEFRKRKREYTKHYRHNRDENNQKVYNHTKSKTEAEYRSLKYQESKYSKHITDFL